MAEPALREVLARFGVQIDAGKLADFDKKINAATTSLGDLGNALKATAIVGGFAFVAGRMKAFVNEFANAADEIDDTSAFLAMSREELQAWRYAASQNGLSAEALTAAFQRLTAAAEGASDGGKKQTKAFKALGVQFKDVDGDLRPIGDMLPEIAEGFAKLDESKRAGVALDLFGKSGLRLVPLLSQGAEGLAEFRKQMQGLGGGMSEKDIEAAGAYNDAIARLDFAFTSLKARALGPLLPVLEKAVDWFSRGVGALSRLGEGLAYVARQTAVFETATAMAGAKFGPMLFNWAQRMLPAVGRAFRGLVPAIRALWPAIAPIALAAAKFIAITLLVDELITAFQGGKTVIGDFVDSIFGIGTTQAVLDGVRAVWDDITSGINFAVAAAKDFWGLLSGGDTSNLDKALNGYRGSNIGAALTGQRSLMESGTLRREDKATDALKRGDVKEFVDQRRKGETREQAFDRFKTERKAVIMSGEAPLRDEDKSLFAKGEERTLARARAKGVSVNREVALSSTGAGGTIAPVTNMTINLPPGTDKALARQVEQIVKGALGKQTRDVKAALTNGKG